MLDKVKQAFAPRKNDPYDSRGHNMFAEGERTGFPRKMKSYHTIHAEKEALKQKQQQKAAAAGSN